jgi:septal ring factor EnvC (AmiA/AmiB activator)
MAVRVAEEMAEKVSTDDFQVLEQKVYRTIELYKAAREARVVAERDTHRLREQLEEREEEVETLRRQMVQLRREREEIRARVEKMLQHIETITEQQAAS